MTHNRGIQIWLAKEIFGILLSMLAIFLPAGDWEWRQGWLVLLVLVVVKFLGDTWLWQSQKALLEQRAVGKRPTTKRWDKLLAPLVASGSLIISIVAGLGERFQWPGLEISWIPWLGLVFILIGALLIFWAMAVNPFFDATVHIQTDRAHKVVSDGPYQFVRHPGYLGILILFLALPMAFDCKAAFLPAVILALAAIIRTWLEDKALLNELPGYSAYTREVRHRLIPRVW